MSLDIVGIGSPFIDIYHMPSGLKKSPGQIVVNTMLVIQRLGLKTGLVGRVGDDGNGSYLIRTLKEEGVDTAGLDVDSHPTTQLHIRLEGDERHFLEKRFNRPLKQLTERNRQYLGSAGSIFVRERNPVFPSVVEHVRERRFKLFLTLHDFRPEGIDLKLVKESRPAVIFANREEFEKIEEIAEYLMAAGAKIVVTKGDRGCSIYHKNRRDDYPAFKVDVVDPTGAGDAFTGGFIFGELRGWETGKTARLANALGALTVRNFGASEKAFSLKDVEDFIKGEKP